MAAALGSCCARFCRFLGSPPRPWSPGAAVGAVPAPTTPVMSRLVGHCRRRAASQPPQSARVRSAARSEVCLSLAEDFVRRCRGCSRYLRRHMLGRGDPASRAGQRLCRQDLALTVPTRVFGSGRSGRARRSVFSLACTAVAGSLGRARAAVAGTRVRRPQAGVATVPARWRKTAYQRLPAGRPQSLPVLDTHGLCCIFFNATSRMPQTRLCQTFRLLSHPRSGSLLAPASRWRAKRRLLSL